MKRLLKLMVPGLVLIVVVIFVFSFVDGSGHTLERGTFLVLSLTLLALLRYAFDTYTMAAIAKEQWEEQSFLDAFYDMRLGGPKPGYVIYNRAGTDRVMFSLINNTKAFVSARVYLNIRIYNVPVDFDDKFNGKRSWLLFPRQRNTEWFELESVLNKQGKTINGIIDERTESNRKDQLTMDLRIEFWSDELNRTRNFPERRHFFDFGEQWTWIPEMTVDNG